MKRLSPEKRLETYIASQGLRHSTERDLMLRYIKEYDAHFSLQRLVDDFGVKEHVSRASIYRNIKLFLQAGVIVCHPFPGDDVYELEERASKHCHRVCIHCGAVKEFTDRDISRRFMEHRFRKFYAHHQQLYIFGVCGECKAKYEKNEKTDNTEPGTPNSHGKPEC